jgi:HupE/UreJ protein
VAVGCLVAAHRASAALAVAFVAAMMCGVAVHLQAVTVPTDEILVALSVIPLGAILLRRRDLPLAGALALFVMVGLTRSENRSTAPSACRLPPTSSLLPSSRARSRLPRWGARAPSPAATP